MKHPKPWRYDRVMDNIYDSSTPHPILEAISEEAAIEAVEAVNEREDLKAQRDKFFEANIELEAELKEIQKERDQLLKALESIAEMKPVNNGGREKCFAIAVRAAQTALYELSKGGQ